MDSVFDNDVDKAKDDMGPIHPDVETQFDTADVVFALNGIRKELFTMNVGVAILTGVAIAGVFYLAKR